LLFAAGTEGLLPNNIRVFEADAATKASKAALSETTSLMEQAANPSPLSLAAAISSLNKPVTEVALGRGIPPLPKKLVEKMLAWKYVDLAELPPARGNTVKNAGQLSQNIVLIQSPEVLRNQQRLIPDITIWVQCFGIYASVLATQFPQHVPELLAYMGDIIKASKQFKWPSWVIYDVAYRQCMEETGQKDWSKVDPSIYARSFTGWAKTSSWCTWCVSLDHDNSSCPFNNGQHYRHNTNRRMQPYPTHMIRGSSEQTCIKYNRYNGDCKFGENCKYKHVCSSCGGGHPKSKCTSSKSGNQAGSSTSS